MWQTIDSAPKDGKRVLAAYYSNIYCDWAMDAYYKYGSWQHSNGHFLMPTHWMPLPDAPRTWRDGEGEMKSQMRLEFESMHGFEVNDDMDIQTCVAWDNWRIAWKAAMAHAKYKANECADNNAYTPAQKRALGAWLQRVALASGDD